MSLPTWSVVALVDEPAPAVLAFVQHMLAAGALGIDLFLDRQNPQTIRMLADVQHCRVTVATSDFWKKTDQGKRPRTNVERQRVIASIAYKRSEADWILHCDCDEFLRMPNRLAAQLQQVDDKVTHVSLRMAERVWIRQAGGIYTGAFRQMSFDYDRLGPRLYGDLAPLFHKGLSGHTMGKTLTRTKRGMVPTVHFAVPAGVTANNLGKPGPYLPATRLLHFDGLTPLHYAIKIMRRVFDPKSTTKRKMAPERMAQIARLRALIGDPERLARFVLRMKTVNERQARILRRNGLLDEKRFRPRVSEDVAALLTPLAIDRRLRERHRDILEAHAPALLDEALWKRLIQRSASAEDEVAGGELGP